MEPSSVPKEEIFDAPLHELGFEFSEMTPQKLSGKFKVTAKWCNPFDVLHGGTSALIAEALASMGALVASGFHRVAGIHLSIHHLKSAKLGDIVFAEATPVNIGSSIHVWEVKLWKNDPSNLENRNLISSSRVTLKANMVVPENIKGAYDNIKKFARL